MGKPSLKSVLVKAKTAETGVIKRLLHMHVGDYDPPRSKVTIHASELTKQETQFCPRKYALMDEYPVKDKTQHVDTALEITFAEGRAKQHLFNNTWLRSRMVGSWECLSCGNTVAFGPAPLVCKRCIEIGAKANWEYREVRIKDPVSGASGGLDGLVLIKVGDKLRLVEVKIMASDQIKALKAPLAEHKLRTQLYLRMIAHSKQSWAKEIATHEASVLYIMRGHGMKDENGTMSPFKEFYVKRDDAAVEEYASMAHAVTLARREPERGTPYGICATMNSDLAKSCPVAKHCFGAKHPATITWAREHQKPHAGAQWLVTADDVQKP